MPDSGVDSTRMATWPERKAPVDSSQLPVCVPGAESLNSFRYVSVACAGQRREPDLAVIGGDFLAARIEVGEVVFSRIIIGQRRDPAGRGEQRDIGFVDIVDVVVADGGGIGARLRSAVVLVEVIDLEAGSGELLELLL